MNARTAMVARWAGAVLLLLGGSVHLQQWYRNYRDVTIGPMFLINVLLSIVVAVALFVSDDRRVIFAGLALSFGSLAMLLASRTIGLPGFDAVGYDRPELEAIVFEALSVVALGIALAWRGARETSDPPLTSA